MKSAVELNKLLLKFLLFMLWGYSRHLKFNFLFGKTKGDGEFFCGLSDPIYWVHYKPPVLSYWEVEIFAS